MKKIFSFVCAVVCTMSLNAAKTIYLKASFWESDGAVFVEGVSSQDMTAVDGAFGYYQVSVEDSQEKVKFLRMKGDKSQQWNATAELTIPTDGNDCYTITGWGDNDGSWSKYTTPDPVDPSSVVYSIKHPWKDGKDESWSYKDLTPNGDGTHSIRDIYGGNGCNWKSTVSGEKWVGSPTLVGEPAVGDSAIFTLTSTEGDGAITITKISSTSGGEGGNGEDPEPTDPSETAYWYFDENNTTWEGTVGWKMTVSGDIAFVKVPAGEANKFKIFPCNPKADSKVLANDDNIAEGALAGDIALTKDATEWKNIIIDVTTTDYFVVLYLPNTATNSSDKYLVAAKTELSTAISNTEVKADFTKIIRDGQVLIVREGKTFDMMGQQVF